MGRYFGYYGVTRLCLDAWIPPVSSKLLPCLARNKQTKSLCAKNLIGFSYRIYQFANLNKSTVFLQKELILWFWVCRHILFILRVFQWNILLTWMVLVWQVRLSLFLKKHLIKFCSFHGEKKRKHISSSIIYQASHFTIQVYLSGQAWLQLGKSMLTTPDDFPFVNVPGNCFQISYSIISPGNKMRPTSVSPLSLSSALLEDEEWYLLSSNFWAKKNFGSGPK